MSESCRVLDGKWMLARDPDNTGREECWYDKDDLPGAVEVGVPGIIQQAFPGYHGVAWYTRRFAAAPLPGAEDRYLLRFGVVDYLAQVWVDGVPVGGHEGGETPFTLDITEAIAVRGQAGTHRLTVRVLNPTHEAIDGFKLNETPHRNKYIPYVNGGSYNYGGITEPVELLVAPVVRVTDLYAQPDWQTGDVRLTITLFNAAADARAVSLELAVTPGVGGEASVSAPLAAGALTLTVAPGEMTVQETLAVPDFRLWRLDDPQLYRVTARVQMDGRPASEWAVRFGFRDFRIIDGFFHLNGRRVFVRSTHTGNHSPEGQILAPDVAPDLLRRDLVYAKACGFNMVRYIAGVAHPYQLDLCDEIGLMVYEECLAGWLLADSPQMGERFDWSAREMVLRDRNHPSITMWGLLNETTDGPVFRHAAGMLPLVRRHDPDRLVLLSSGRWDCQLAIGSAANPGVSAWEHVWGAESPHAPPAPYDWHAGLPGGYFDKVGDAHVYPGTPHTQQTIDFIRGLGQGMKPVFLSEYGIGSVMNALRELRMFEQYRINPAAEDMELMRSMADRYVADWQRYGMDGVYAFPEDMLRESQRLHARQRLLGFDAIRSNPQICGYNLTGMLDHGMTGEGVWTYWREWKPGIADAMADGWAPVRWCLFVEPLNGYAGEPLHVEAVLANEDVLAPGDYPVVLRIMGPEGVAWEHRTVATMPAGAPGRPAPLAVPVFDGGVVLDGPSGTYELVAYVERGAAPAGGRLKFYLGRHEELPEIGGKIAAWGLSDAARAWLTAHGVQVIDWRPGDDAAAVAVIGDLAEQVTDENQWQALSEWVAAGHVALFLTPAAFRRAGAEGAKEDPLGWLPVVYPKLANEGRVHDFNDWLYHKECVAKRHPVFAGLAGPGIMDWDFYGPVISRTLMDGQDTPDETVVAAYALGYSVPGGYASGWQVGAYRAGRGKVIVNTLNILPNLGVHPAADRLMVNLIKYARG
jgi:hypothetical protein